MSDPDFRRRLLLRGIATGEIELTEPVRAFLRREHGRATPVRHRDFSLIRVRADAGSERIIGMGAIYNAPPYPIGGGVSEVIAPGAFDASLNARGSVLPIFSAHDWKQPIGHATATSTREGLEIEAVPYLTTDRGRAVYEAAKAGALSGMSVGFYPVEIDTSTRGVDRITKADLAEVSLVVRPASPGALIKEVR
jgi:HK97 family phage prohead protease